MRAFLASFLVLVLSALANADVEIVTLIFDNPDEPLQLNGGLSGDLGTYGLVGSLQMELNHDAGIANILWSELTLRGTAGSFDLSGTRLSESLRNPVETLEGVITGPESIEFIGRTYWPLDDCEFRDGQLSCEEVLRVDRETILTVVMTEHLVTMEGISHSPNSLDGGFARLSPSAAVRWVPGDFNHDGQLDAHDIDRLAQAMRQGRSDRLMDVDQSGSVSVTDIDWALDAYFGSVRGDSDLDGQFGTEDLVHVFTFGEYEDHVRANSTWATGDWNHDQEFTSDDFVFVLNGGAAFVPEPSAAILMALAAICATTIRGKRS